MKKHRIKFLIVMLTLTMLTAVFVPSVFAETESVTNTLNGTVELTDHPESFSEEYTIVLTAEDENSAMPEGSADGVCEFSVNAGEFSFPEIVYTERGIFHYTVEQKAGSAERWTYDDSVYNVTVYVTNAEDGDGLVVNTAVYKEGETEKSEIVFTNTYDPAPATVVVTALKVLRDGELKDGQFSFELKDEAGSVIQTVKNDADGNIRFDGITFEEEGTYVYTLSEVIGTDKYVEYDTSVYTITFTVAQDGDLVAAVSLLKNNSEYSKQEVVFENVWIVKPGDDTNIAVWIAVFAISAIAVVALAVIGKKRK